MERYLGHLWAAPSMVKPEGKKLKRRLQKGSTQPQQRPYSVNYSDTKVNPDYKPNRTSLSFNLFGSIKPSAPQRPALPPPTPPEDGKWLEDFRKSGYLYRDSRRRSRQLENDKSQERPVTVVAPEFAHLVTATHESPTQTEEKTAGPPFKNGQPHTTRRYAKTPVSHIGQLETHPLLRTQGTSQDVPSIESIAESYRALLESRTSFLSETPIEHAAIMEKQDQCFHPQDPSLVPPPLEPLTELPETPPARGSPRSDDGTLVGEDSIDFKIPPISPAPSSPSWASYETASPGLERRLSTPSKGSDLQTCLELLTKELSSAISKSPSPSSADTTALQIWVMIEAYESLRDRVLRAHEEDIQNGPLKATFDVWLNALHSVHDRMIGGDGERSESDYGD
ncbi:hypothetical protein ANO14919_032360 [Xylariales sp. No.14919]|nr:hypothetical protein ANO14919_032360 [Xylariales sp. No.14919]